MPEQIKSDFYAKIKVHLCGFCAIFCTMLLHFIISLRYPPLFLDEFYYGTRAWAFFRSFTDPINYRIIYDDHPPFGWLIMGLSCALMVGVPWMIRVRIFMSILFLIQQILIYAIASKFFHRTVGVIAVLINGLGAGFLIFQNMAFLDNIGIIFILGALYLLPNTTNHRSLPLIFSGIMYGIACGIKLPFLFFLPAFPIFYFLYNRTKEKVNNFKSDYGRAMIKWGCGVIIPIIFLVSIILFSGNMQYFIDGTLEQLNRTDPGATLSSYFRNWFSFSPILILASFILPFLCVICGIIVLIREKAKSIHQFNKKFKREDQSNNPFLSHFWINGLEIGVFAVFFIVFLLRGTTIYVHYILPLLPFIALLLGLIIYYIAILLANLYNEWQMNRRTIQRKGKMINFEKPISITFSIICIVIFLYPYQYPALTSNLVEKQYEMLIWIDENIPKNASFVVKDFFVAELYELGAENVQMVGFIDQESFGNDWRNIDYIISSPFDIAQFDFLSEKDGRFLNPALQYAMLIYSQMNGNDEICIYAIIS